jgi:iron(II)-dependent oxidoreductase
LALGVVPGQTAGAQEQEVEPKSGLAWVHLPGGTFLFGCEPQDKECYEDEEPPREIEIAPFSMLRTPVTRAAFDACRSAGACTPPPSPPPPSRPPRAAKKRAPSPPPPPPPDLPATEVSFDEAKEFCAWIGGRLPTAEEWEFAAKGGQSRIYPWGDDPPTRRRVLLGSATATPVGAYPEGASAQGLLDLVGNVQQWTTSDVTPRCKDVRGGQLYPFPSWSLRASNRDWTAPHVRFPWLGFRCLRPETKK